MNENDYHRIARKGQDLTFREDLRWISLPRPSLELPLRPENKDSNHSTPVLRSELPRLIDDAIRNRCVSVLPTLQQDFVFALRTTGALLLLRDELEILKNVLRVEHRDETVRRRRDDDDGRFGGALVLCVHWQESSLSGRNQLSRSAWRQGSCDRLLLLLLLLQLLLLLSRRARLQRHPVMRAHGVDLELLRNLLLLNESLLIVTIVLGLLRLIHADDFRGLRQLQRELRWAILPFLARLDRREQSGNVFIKRLSSALQDCSPHAPLALATDDVLGRIDVEIQHPTQVSDSGFVMIVAFNRHTLVGQSLGFDGRNLLHRHRLGERLDVVDLHRRFFLVDIEASRQLLLDLLHLQVLESSFLREIFISVGLRRALDLCWDLQWRAFIDARTGLRLVVQVGQKIFSIGTIDSRNIFSLKANIENS